MEIFEHTSSLQVPNSQTFEFQNVAVFPAVALDSCMAVGQLSEPEKCHQDCPMSTVQSL